MTRLHLQHAIAVKLHVRKNNVVILTPETSAPLVFEQWPILVGMIFHPGRSHGCCPVHAAEGSLPCGRYLIAPLTGNKEGSKCLLVLRVKPTPTRFPTNSLYTPMDNTPMHSISSVCHPWGRLLLTSLKGYGINPLL